MARQRITFGCPYPLPLPPILIYNVFFHPRVHRFGRRKKEPMSKNTRKALFRISIIMLMLPTVFACSLLAPGGELAAGPTATPSDLSQPATAAPTPTSTEEMMTIYTLERGEIQVPVPPPDSYSDLLDKNVEEGIWDRPQGFVYLLSYLSGEQAAADIPGFEMVMHADPTALLRLANEYAGSADADPDQAAEIERLLDELVPSQEDLDRLSRPAGESNHSGIQMIGFQSQADIPDECEIIAGEGFSANVDTGEYCYVFIEENHADGRLRVYYPKWWQVEEDKLTTVGLTMGSLLASARVYNGLGKFEDVNAVFSMSQPSEISDWNAYTGFNENSGNSGQPCPITILPKGVVQFNDRHLQTIAHEAFHCFQDWNFNIVPFSAHKWWSEGTAHYFSNVVYPAINKEHSNLNEYYQRSIRETWFEMDYHNFLLFQHLGNELGNQGLISLMHDISAAGGIAGQASMLASYPNMDGLFQDFVVKTMSSGVRDTGGGMIVVNDPPLLGIEPMEEEGEVEFVIKPFVAGRFALRYEQEKRFLEDPIEEGGVSHSTAIDSERHDLSAWSGLPPEIRSECAEDTRYSLAISSVGENGTFKANITKVEVAECDPCLLGTWDIETISYTNYYENLFEASGQSIEIFVNGHMYLEFGEEGEFLTRRAGLEVHAVLPDLPTLITIIDGQGTGKYTTTDGERLTFSNVISTTNNVAARMEGVELPGGQGLATFGLFDRAPGGAGGGPDSHSGDYTCDKDWLTLEFPQYGDVTFQRVDEIIPTPVPTPGS